MTLGGNGKQPAEPRAAGVGAGARHHDVQQCRLGRVARHQPPDLRRLHRRRRRLHRHLDHFTNGTASEFVGEFIASQRDYYVVPCRSSLFNRADQRRRQPPQEYAARRGDQREAPEDRLRRAKAYLRVQDGATPVDEVMRGLDVISAGKVLYAGISDSPAWVVAQANTLADALAGRRSWPCRPPTPARPGAGARADADGPRPGPGCAAPGACSRPAS